MFRLVDDTVCVNIRGEPIEKVSYFVYLGLILDTHLSFGRHCEFVASRISSAIGAMYKLKNIIPSEALKNVYFSLIHSHLTYMVNIWGASAAAHLRPLQVLQNRALKIVFNLPSLTSTEILYHEYAKNVLPIRGLHESLVLKHVRQSLNGEVLHHEQLYFNLGIGRLRDNYRLYEKRVLTVTGRRQMSYLGPHYFNQLPTGLRRITETSRFLGEVKKHLLMPQNLSRLLRLS